MNRVGLLTELMQLNFMAVDIALYLNAHPDSKTAEAQYNKTIYAADRVRIKYEALYGDLCSFRSLKSGAAYEGVGNSTVLQ